MSSKILVLRPDPIKAGLLNALFCCALAVALAAFLGIVFEGIPTVVPVMIGIAFAVGLFAFWGRPKPDSWLELSREGLTVISAGKRAHMSWQSLSRFTLIRFESDEQDKTRQDYHYVAARTVAPADDADAATDPGTADLTLEIDGYISYHRYSGRSPEQEAACKSPQDFADTLNRWRDFALDLEIGAVPTPVVTTTEAGPGDLVLQIYSSLTR
ncbi:hypothetical protein [Roseibium sp. Sym1]|uniref:hypothetical protein n=1 Tax=Roseibium sp. Sym1 TaxID=3016006 RepID=UPI0022B2FAE7|nr:hypothetical protein [Roseibium sp. Sym1]